MNDTKVEGHITQHNTLLWVYLDDQLYLPVKS
jgi:hypothetical protein